MRAPPVAFKACLVVFAAFIAGGLTVGCSSSKGVATYAHLLDADPRGPADSRGIADSQDIADYPETTYFISEDGDDSRSGKNADEAWKTFGKALQAAGSVTPPARFLFARGQTFVHDKGTRLFNLKSTKDNRITFDAYDPKPSDPNNPTPLPIISVKGRTIAFDLENGGDPIHDEGYTIQNLDLRGDGTEGQQAVFLYNDVSWVTMDNLRMSGFSVAVHVEDSNKGPDGKVPMNGPFVLKNSKIFNNSGMGFLGQGKDYTIENNEFDNNGSAELVDHNIYLGGLTENGMILNNRLTHSTMVDGKCYAVSLVVHGVTRGLVIEGNVVQEDIGKAAPFCYGIAVDTGYSSAEDFTGTIIRNNTVIDVGAIAIAAASCPRCVIENNLIIQTQADGGTGIQVPSSNKDAQDAADNEIIIRNNTIHFSDIDSGTGIYVGKQGEGHVVVSNSIVYLGSGSKGWSCFDTTGLKTSAFKAFDYNYCYFKNAPKGRWEMTKVTRQDWGLDANSLDATNTEPCYVLEEGEDKADPKSVKPSATCALDGAGDPVNSSEYRFDERLVTQRGASSDSRTPKRNKEKVPDIGAFEIN